jgi:hypothetical protein
LTAALALVAAHGSLSAQKNDDENAVWRLGGLRNGFCVLLLVDPQAASRNLPPGLRLVPAGEAADLHPALRIAIQSQPDLASWSPSHLCFYAVDTIQTADYVLRDKSGRKPQLFGLWTVSAAESASGDRRDLALLVLVSSGKLIRSGRMAGHEIHEIEAKVGKVPEVDEDGVPSSDDRFQMKVGKTLLTWDGHQVSDSALASGTVEIAWASAEGDAGKGRGSLTLTPQWASPMVGSLKVEGKDHLAQALRTSPVRFVGPLYRGGGGEVRLAR